jgi:hypothetical protein
LEGAEDQPSPFVRQLQIGHARGSIGTPVTATAPIQTAKSGILMIPLFAVHVIPQSIVSASGNNQTARKHKEQKSAGSGSAPPANSP